MRDNTIQCRNHSFLYFGTMWHHWRNWESGFLHIWFGFLVIAAILCNSHSADGCVYYWSTTSGDWSDSANWDVSEPTSNIDAAIYNGGTVNVTQSGETCNYLCLGDAGTENSGTVLMADGSLSAIAEYVGVYGTGLFTQSGGTNVLNSLYLGYDAGSNGTYNLNGGTLVLKSLRKGLGTTAFNFGGGTLQASGSFTTSLPMELTAIGGNANIDTAGYSVGLSGALSNTGRLNKLGAGTLSLSGNNYYTGGTNIGAGTLGFANGSLGTSGNVVFSGTSTLLWNGVNTQDISNRIRINNGVAATFDTGSNTVTLSNNIGLNSGGANSTGSMVKAGVGNLALAAVNTHTGGTTVTAGTLTFTTGNNRLATTGAITTTGGILDLDGFFQETSGNVSFQGGGVQNGTLKKNGGVFDAQAGTISANLADGASAAGLVKSGNGSVMLSGTNTYTGGTNINQGTLLISSTAALPGWNTTGQCNVAPDAVLAVSDGVTNNDVATILSTGNFSSGSAIGFDATTRTFDGSLLPSNVGLAKSGSGTLTLSNALATTTGPIIVSGGTLDLGGFTQETAGNISFLGSSLGPTVLNGTIRKNGGNFVTQAGTISANLADGTSAAGLIKIGSGRLALSGNNTFSGGVTFTQGELYIGSETALGTGTFTIGGDTPSELNASTSTNIILTNNNPMIWKGDFEFEKGRSLNLGSGPVTLENDIIVTCKSNMLTVGGEISGNHSLAKKGTEPLTLSGNNTFTGGMTLIDGQLNINSEQALGTGTFTIGGSGNRCEIDNTTGNSITLSNNNPIVFYNAFHHYFSVDFGGSDINLGSGPVTLTEGHTRLRIYNRAQITIAGAISGNGSLELVDDGGHGTLILSGDNTYSGGTLIESAPTGNVNTLKIANSTGSATGTGSVTVMARGKICGSGSIAGPVTVAGILSPGDSTGILTVNDEVTFQEESIFDVEVNGLAAGSEYDRLVTTGPVSLAGSLALSFGSFTPTGHDVLFLIDNTGLDATSGMFQYANDSSIGIFNGYEWYITYNANNAAMPSLNGGNDVAIYSVPEPSSLTLLGISIVGMLGYVWRRRKQTV